MNILASYSWLKKYCATDVSPDVFAQEMSLRSMSVEHIDVLRDRFAHIVIGEIKEVVQHPNANKLRIVKTDIGNRVVEIVCGGSNLVLGARVVVALPGAKVRWHGEGELITLQETEIRGVKSVGMICAPAEIGFEKVTTADREIWDVTSLTQCSAGTTLVEALDLDDVIFDVEITTNRPDCMGILGLAREGAASVSGNFIPHALWSADAVRAMFADVGEGPRVRIVEPKLCSRYMAARVDGVTVGPSPWWLQKKLLLAGHRPVNNIVDITNLILQEFGQPMHAFDASHIKDEIVVRKAKHGESLGALDGKTYDLPTATLVIADAEQPLAVAGVMGGQVSGTTQNTTSVVLEAATFDGLSVRKTSRALNLYSDSQLIFEKGLSPEALPAALAYAVQLVGELAGGTLAGITDVYTKPPVPKRFPVYVKKICERIGVDIPEGDIINMLTRLGFFIEKKGRKITAVVPFWRMHDLEAEVDLTEEVARMYGYHRMPSVLPAGVPPATFDDASLVWERKLKRVLEREGLVEFFGYSFVDERDMIRAGIAPEHAVKIWNPLSEELGYLRPSLLPGFLRDCARNEPHTPSANVFELSRVYVPVTGDIPREDFALLFGVYGIENGEYAYRRMRGVLEGVMGTLGISYRLERGDVYEHWHPGRTANIIARFDNTDVCVGTIGQIAKTLQESFGLVRPVMAVELDGETLFAHAAVKRRYTPISEHPAAVRDLSFIVDESLDHEYIAPFLVRGEFVQTVMLGEIYRSESMTRGKKSMTYTLTLAAGDRTLTSQEIDASLQAIKGDLVRECGAVLR